MRNVVEDTNKLDELQEEIDELLEGEAPDNTCEELLNRFNSGIKIYREMNKIRGKYQEVGTKEENELFHLAVHRLQLVTHMITDHVVRLKDKGCELKKL